jgi:predicted  nucleic acid-binding Zn-ribbon protein
MHSLLVFLRAGFFRPGASSYSLLLVSLLSAMVGAIPAMAGGAGIPTNVPVAFAFHGSDPANGAVLNGWLTFNSLMRGTVDPVAGTGIYEFGGDPDALPTLDLVISDETTGEVRFALHQDGFNLRIECVNAAESTFRALGKVGNLSFNFAVTGPVGSLFTDLRLPSEVPVGAGGSWSVKVLQGPSWGGSQFAYLTGDETAALLALLDAANAQVATLTTELETAQGELKGLRSDYKITTIALAKANAQIDQLTADLATANAQVASLTTELETAQGELKTLRSDYKIATVALTKANAQIEQLTSDLAAAQAQVAQLTIERDAAGGELKLLKRDYRIATSQLRYAEAQAERLTADLATANDQITLLGTQLETARLELSTARLQVLQLQKDLAVSNALNAELQGRLDRQASTLAGIGATLGASGKDPSFKVPGATVEEQLANLAAAIQRLNPGQQKALHGELGGAKK